MPVKRTLNGTMYISFVKDGASNIAIISFSKTRIIKNVSNVVIKVIINANINTLAASLSRFGSIIAISYFPVTIDEKILVKLKYNAKTPKSFGLYNLVKIGLIAIGMAWANILPVIKVKTFLLNSDFSLIVNLMMITQAYSLEELSYA